MKFLYFGDLHARVTPPANRLDNFKETLNKKVDEIISIGEKYQVEAFLHPGDFWDNPNPPLDFVSEMLSKWINYSDMYNVLKKVKEGKDIDYNNMIKSFKEIKPLLGVVGNHDITGNNINTLDKSVAGLIGQINQLGMFNYVSKENPYFFFTEDGLKVAITGSNYHIDGDTPERISDYVVEEKLGDIHIHICHGMLHHKSLGKLIKHTTIDQIKHTKADITLCGHDHNGFPMQEIDGKYFINIGSIPRLSNNLKEMRRKPKVLLIDITKENGIKLKEIYLKCALKGEEVLSRKKINEKNLKEERLEEFKHQANSLDIKKTNDILSVISNIAKKNKFPKKIIDDIINSISNKMLEMGATLNNNYEDNIFINQILLENFQAYENQIIDCSKNLNIFSGESGQGKSSILRALSFVYENKGKSKRLIKRNKDYCRVTLKLSNGYEISRFVEKKKSGKNGYEIYNPNTKEVSFHNTKYLNEVQQMLGYNILNIDKDLQFSLNFLKQGTGWFLISDQYSGSQKMKIIGGIYGIQFADAVVRELDKQYSKLVSKSKDILEEKENLEIKINEFSFLPELKDKIEKIDKIMEKVKELKEKKERLLNIITKRDEINNKLIIINNQIEKTDFLEKVRLNFIKIASLNGKVDKIISITNKKNEVVSNIKKQEYIIQSTKSIPKLENLIKKLNLKKVDRDNKIIQLNKLIELNEKIKKVKYSLHHINKTLKATTEIQEAFSKFNEVNDLLKNKEKFNDKFIKLKKLEAEKKDVCHKLKLIDESIKQTNQLALANEKLDLIKNYISKKENIINIIKIKKDVETKIQQEENAIKYQNNIIDKNISCYKGYLKEIGKCPLCLSDIDSITIDRIMAHTLAH